MYFPGSKERTEKVQELLQEYATTYGSIEGKLRVAADAAGNIPIESVMQLITHLKAQMINSHVNFVLLESTLSGVLQTLSEDQLNLVADCVERSLEGKTQEYVNQVNEAKSRIIKPNSTGF